MTLTETGKMKYLQTTCHICRPAQVASLLGIISQLQSMKQLSKLVSMYWGWTKMFKMVNWPLTKRNLVSVPENITHLFWTNWISPSITHHLHTHTHHLNIIFFFYTLILSCLLFRPKASCVTEGIRPKNTQKGKQTKPSKKKKKNIFVTNLWDRKILLSLSHTHTHTLTDPFSILLSDIYIFYSWAWCVVSVWSQATT